MPAPAIIHELIERFDRNKNFYKSNDYNEAQVRLEFIDPFFEALEWDVGNRNGAAPGQREVVVEFSLKIGDTTKAPDYLFRAGGANRFFVEAKKPAVNIQKSGRYAFQLRRYAWSATLPLSIITDFEEFSIYDCRVEPNQNDPATTALHLPFTSYTEYADKWDTIAALFHRDAVLGGSLEKFAQEQKAPRGALSVDKAFLAEIDAWRTLLAKNIAAWNPELSQRELNYVVQMTIDRIIFLRIAEDRGIEPYGKLQGLLKAGGLYQNLTRIFRDADDRYNSGLFHFKEERGREGTDSLSLTLHIDDEPLRKILNGLYYPTSPYEFSVLPIEVLGNVYEQFLGKVITIGANRKVEVEEKPEVRKAGGVYYTPSYIVDYIVKNTVGKLVEGKTPKEAESLRILDPACGSGSFLIGAYQYLLDWYRDWYVEHGTIKQKRDNLYQGAGDDWRLTTNARKRILLNNIYGVDIDTQAVEVTKLSLCLKMLEGETEQTINPRLWGLQERALPDLDGNIKCGNSLVAPDFYDSPQARLFTDEEQYQVNVFDWEAEFPSILRSGGFDVVIGNPPYGIVFNENLKPYLERKYPTFVRNNDNFVAFSHKALDACRIDGLFGFIIPNTFLLGPYFDDFKEHVLKNASISQIVDFGLNQVFPKPNVFTALLFLQHRTQSKAINSGSVDFIKVTDILSFPQALTHQTLGLTELESHNWMPQDSLVIQLNDRIVELDTLSLVKDVGLNYWTQGRGKTRGGSIADRVLYDGERTNPNDKPYLKGRDVIRYCLEFGNHWLRHDYQELLVPGVDTFRYSAEYLEQDKIVYRQTADRIIAMIEPNKILTDKTLHCIVVRENWKAEIKLLYLLGLLNLRLLTYVYRDMAREEGRTFAQVKTFRMKKLPIRTINFSDPADKKRHDDMVALVERMLDLHKRLLAARTPQERTTIQRQIENTDRQIDNLVYDLYELLTEERQIVEAATK